MTRTPPSDTLFPYTTLFRSEQHAVAYSVAQVDHDEIDRINILKASFKAMHLAIDTLRSEEHTSELQSRLHLVCRLLLEKKNHERQGALPLRLPSASAKTVER